MPIEPLTLKGNSVLLRPLSRADVPAMRALAKGPRGTFEWAFVPTPEQVPQYVEAALAQVERKAALVFAVCTPAGEMVGCTRLFDLQRWEWPAGKDPRPGEDVLDAAEIGYTWLAEAAQRTAINTEAKLLLLRHAFETWRCYRVTLKTDERNARSRRRMARGGAAAAREAAGALSRERISTPAAAGLRSREEGGYSSSSCCSSFARKRSPSVPNPFPGGIFLFICRW